MIKKTLFVIHILSLLFMLVACSALPTVRTNPTMPSPNDFTKLYEYLNHETIGLLSEIRLLTSAGLKGPLLKVGYLAEDNTVAGVYQERGTVVGWTLDTEAIAFTHELGIVTSKGLTFISGAKLLVGATEHNFKLDGKNQDVEYINGIALWDIYTGKVASCITYPCQGNTNQRDGFLGNSIDANGIWNATYSEGSIGILDLPEKSIISDREINPMDASYQWKIGSVAFDAVNQRYVMVFQEGRVYVCDINHPLSCNTIASGKKDDVVPIIDSQIDATGRWLVVARGKTTQVLSLDKGKVLLETNVSNPALAFDNAGELLIVGSANKLTVYRIETGEKIAEYETVGITSLVISEDNRLVIWGDTQGQIHVWAKPSSNK